MAKRNMLCILAVEWGVKIGLFSKENLLTLDMKSLSVNVMDKLAKNKTALDGIMDEETQLGEDQDVLITEIALDKLAINDVIAGAYHVEHRWVMQNKSFRLGEISTKQLAAIAKDINKVLACFGKPKISGAVKLIPDDKKTAWWIDLHASYKALGRAAKTLRRIQNGGGIGGNGAKKDYNVFTVTLDA
jgi:hypothetical protein